MPPHCVKSAQLDELELLDSLQNQTVSLLGRRGDAFLQLVLSFLLATYFFQPIPTFGQTQSSLADTLKSLQNEMQDAQAVPGFAAAFTDLQIFCNTTSVLQHSSLQHSSWQSRCC
jgi:hypothetical protein